MTTITAADGTNRIIPEKTRTCSNCRFLGIPCVFVQSNRGGKRKKRSTEHQLSDSEATTAPATHPNQLGQHQQLPPIKNQINTFNSQSRQWSGDTFNQSTTREASRWISQ